MKKRNKSPKPGPKGLTALAAGNQLTLYKEGLEELLKLTASMDRDDRGSEQDDLFVRRSLKEDICRGCPRMRTCVGDRAGGSRMEEDLNRLIQAMVFEGREAGEAVPSSFRENCIYSKELLTELSWLSRLAGLHRSYRGRLAYLRSAVITGLTLQDQLLMECINRSGSDRPIGAGLKRRLFLSLLAGGCFLREGIEIDREDGSRTIGLSIRTIKGIRSSWLSDLVSKAAGSPMTLRSPEPWLAAGIHTLYFDPRSHFHLLFGKSCRSKEGEAVCGDTFSLIHMNKDQVILCLSDGMGSGQEARSCSSRMMEAFEALLLSGIPEEAALKLIHSSLYLYDRKDLSTLDISSVSLRTGIAKFVKAGGTATLLCRKNKVEVIREDSLPLGYLSSPGIRTSQRKLYDGDRIIMLSDGMLSAIDQAGGTEALEQILAAGGTDNPQKLADRLMDLTDTGFHGAADDQTVLVALLCERK